MPNLIKEGRRLVTIRKINNLQPIPNADMIEVATIDGWDLVVKKGEFKVGQYCVYFEIDSFLPVTEKFAFLAKNGTKKDENDVERIRLKAIKLRGQVSMGLALPISTCWNELLSIVFSRNDDPISIEGEMDNLLEELEESRDGIEEFLNVTKYERPSERNGGTGANKAKAGGDFPIIIPKTDEDRIENVFGKYSQTMKGVKFRKSLKLDGSSQTIAFINDQQYFCQKLDDEVKEWNEELQELTVSEVKPYPFQWQESQVVLCSRNLTLKFDDKSHFWKAALKDDIPARLKEYCEKNDRQLAIQGEVMGPGIQGNREKLEEHQFYAFRVWDIDAKEFLPDADFQVFVADLGLTPVPQGEIIEFFDVYTSIKEAKASAEHESLHHKVCEGDVYKSITPVNGSTVHFKVINNEFLLKYED